MKSGEAMSTARMKRLTGFFLDEVQSRGAMEPYGVELSEYAGSIARGKFGEQNIHIGTLETAFPKKGYFSAVAMSDLIEQRPGAAGNFAEGERTARARRRGDDHDAGCVITIATVDGPAMDSLQAGTFIPVQPGGNEAAGQ